MCVQYGQTRIYGDAVIRKGCWPNRRARTSCFGNKNVTELRSFLGLANYSSRFIPHFATLTEPLRRLTKKDVPYVFGPEQKAAFRSLKESMAKAGTLAYFDKMAPAKIIADASPVGLGALLLQEQDGQ